MRASSRPKNVVTKRRPSSVESSRSVGAWKEPTFSAREWRSAAFAVLGANGSCTCTKSSSTVPSNSSIVRATSIGSARVGLLDPVGTSSTSPTAITVGLPSPRLSSRLCGCSRAARSARRDARTRSCEREGARISTRCPWRESSSVTPRTYALTSFSRASHG